MLEITNVRVYDLRETVTACRNAMRLEMPEYTEEEFQKGLNRAVSLSKLGGGTGHSSFRKGIRVSFDLKYTQYITKQFQRYHWFDLVSSSSLMHRITKMDFHHCVNKYVTIDAIKNIVHYKDVYNYIVDNRVESFVFDELPNPIATDNFVDSVYVAWMQLLSNCPMGTELFVRVSTNYEQLATMAKQRKNHKLKEDWGAFLEFIKTLPYSKQLIPEAY